MITPIKKSIIIISIIIVLIGAVLLGCKNDNNNGSTSNNTTSHIPVSEENTAEGYGLEEDEDDNSYESDDNSSKNNSGDNKNNLKSSDLYNTENTDKALDTTKKPQTTISHSSNQNTTEKSNLPPKASEQYGEWGAPVKN